MLGERIRDLRLRQHWRQEDIAKKLNMAISTVSGYENGSRRPDVDTLVRIAELFEVSVDYLLGRAKQTINLAESDQLLQLTIELDEEPLSEEDKQYLLAIIREKRNIKQKTSNSLHE